MTTEIAREKKIAETLDRLRVELVELACQLDQRGRHDAADVAMTTSVRIGELCAELNAGDEPVEIAPCHVDS